MNCLIYTTQHPAISRSVLESVNAALNGRLPDTSKDRTVTAEAVRSGYRVPQQAIGGIAVILDQGVEDSDREAARRSVARTIGCRAGHIGDSGWEASAGRRIANNCNSWAVVASHRRRVSDRRTRRSRTDILIGHRGLVRRTRDRRRLRVDDRDGERAG